MTTYGLRSQVTQQDVDGFLRLCETREWVTILDVIALGMNEHRARTLVRVCGIDVGVTVVRGNAKFKRYGAHPEAHERWRQRHAEQVARRMGDRFGRPEPLVDGDPTWQSADPTHYDMDGHGRIIYRGPRRQDRRFEMEDQRCA